MDTISRIQRVRLRDVWPHEALDFTRWLAGHVDVLSEVVGFEICNPECEHSVGAFSVDIVAEDDAGSTIVIENQLERTDHDHLGKLLTYMVNVEARAALWVVAEHRPEHLAVVSWLNECSPADFFLVKLEAVRIGESQPAPLLTLIAGPSEEARVVGATKKELASRHGARERFWRSFLASPGVESSNLRQCSPGHQNWISVRARTGVFLNCIVLQHATRVEIYIDRGRDGEEATMQLFWQLAEQREEIETAFGSPLDWQELESRRACRICSTIEGGGWKDEDAWPDIHRRLLAAFERLESATRDAIGRLAV